MIINNLENFILEQLKVKVKLDVIDEHPNKDSSDQKEHEHQWDDVVCELWYIIEVRLHCSVLVVYRKRYANKCFSFYNLTFCFIWLSNLSFVFSLISFWYSDNKPLQTENAYFMLICLCYSFHLKLFWIN